jgi:hypothetical protein
MSVGTTYPLNTGSKAARTADRKIRRWIDSNVTPIRANDLKAAGSGSRVGLSRNRILQIAVTQALLKNGVSLSRAAKAALEFSDYGNNGRAAGQVFPRGKTVLVLSSNSAAVCNLDFSTSIFEMSNDGVTICIDLNRISESVDAVLNNFKH